MYMPEKAAPRFERAAFSFFPPAGGWLDFLPQAVTINAQ
jgi:hypothetical protein